MSKELEALKKIRKLCGKEIVEALWLPNAIDYAKTITVNDYCDIIETALKRLEEIDKLPKTEFYTTNKIELNNESDKQLKALEIIKEKSVSTLLVMNVRDYNEYCRYMANSFEYESLTQEEYDLLKEVLK